MAKPDERLGEILAGRYRLDRVLGTGGMGVVYAGVQLDGGRAVAVKVLRPQLFQSAELLGRFFQEAQTASALEHPNVIEILDSGEGEDGAAFIAMELLEGESLEARLRREGRLPAADVLRILLPVIDALAVAHARGIIHRDLKPENVFLVKGPDGEVPKLLDFGIAKLLEGSVVQTQAGAMLGTPGYMSPEQMRGVTRLTPASDVWGMGVILFRALSGRLPFPVDADNPIQMLMAIMTSETPRLSAIAPDVPPALGAAVDLALKHSPETRHRDMNELREALLDAARTSVVPLPPGVI